MPRESKVPQVKAALRRDNQRALEAITRAEKDRLRGISLSCLSYSQDCHTDVFHSELYGATREIK